MYNNSLYSQNVPELEEFPTSCYNCNEDCIGIELFLRGVSE